MSRTATTVCSLFAVLCLTAYAPPAAAQPAGDLAPRVLPVKPQRVVLADHDRDDVISVKFHDDLLVRVVDGQLTDLGTGALAGAGPALAIVAGGVWAPAYALPEPRLDALRATAEGNLGRALADLNTYFTVLLPEGVAAAGAIDAFNALDVVEIAGPVPAGPPAPTPPDYEPAQGYLGASPVGVDAYAARDALSADGSGVKLCVIDYSYGATHQDLPPVTLLGPAPPASFPDDHGSASIGVVASLDNGWGTSGLAPGVSVYFAAAEAPLGNWDVSAAIVNALGTLGPGDVILIEQQWFGPCSNPANPCWQNNGNAQYGLVPVEWRPQEYNAVLTAIGNQVAVVEAGGNGEQDLDAAVYAMDDPNSAPVENHDPFNPANDSGAIIVGAGAAPQWPFFGSDVDRSRLWFSNYGARLNAQAWGELVPAVGYGTAYSAEGADLWYTTTFGGTSSASAIIAGAACTLQSAYKQSTGTTMTPAALRSALVANSAPQQSGTYPASQNIGPMPDVTAAILATTGECIPQWDASIGNPGLLWSGGIGPADIWASALFDDGAGTGLYLGGNLTNAGGTPVNYVARYDAGGWSPLGLGITQGEFGVNFAVRSMAVHDDGSGPVLYVGGDFIGAGGISANHIASWDGTSWSALGNGVLGPVYAMAVYDDGSGPALYVGGRAADAPGGLGKWDGTSWTAVGAGTTWPDGNCSPIYDMAVFDDGSGDALYIAGCFTRFGNIIDGSAAGIVRWDGTQHSAVGGGLAGIGRDLIVHDDGSGPALYVTGNFTNAGGAGIAHVARWDGAQWSQVGGGVTNQGTAFGTFDDGDGTGQDLYVALPGSSFGGVLNSAGGKAVEGLAKWDGTEWWPVDYANDGAIYAMETFDDGTGASLYVSGAYFNVGAMPASSLARWTACPAQPCPWDLGGDGAVGTADLLALLAAWGSNPGHAADFDGDGIVGTSDLLALLANWGNCP